MAQSNDEHAYSSISWYMVIVASVKNAIIPVCSYQQHHQSLQNVLVSRKPLYVYMCRQLNAAAETSSSL
eukprot:14446-Heterococcus_DN1.PRE.11